MPMISFKPKARITNGYSDLLGTPSCWHGFYNVHYDSSQAEVVFEDLDRVHQGEILRLDDLKESKVTFDERKSSTIQSLNAKVKAKSKNEPNHGFKKSPQTCGSFPHIRILEIKPEKKAELILNKSVSEPNAKQTQAQNHPMISIQSEHHVHGMIDRLNSMLKKRGHFTDDGKKLQVEDIKKISELANPTLKSLDKSVNKELNDYLKKLETSISTINNKVDMILTAQMPGPSKKEMAREYSIDDSIVFSAYRERSEGEFPARLNMTTCPTHLNYQNSRSQEKGYQSAVHDTPKNKPPTIEYKWAPIHANRYFLDPNHRVQKEKKHPLKWETLEEERDKRSKRKMQPIPVPDVIKRNPSQGSITQYSKQSGRFDTSAAGSRINTVSTYRKSNVRFGGEEQRKPEGSSAKTKQSVVRWKLQPEQESKKLNLREPTLQHSRSAATGLQQRRDLALKNRKKVNLLDIPIVNALPWHKKRVTPVR